MNKNTCPSCGTHLVFGRDIYNKTTVFTGAVAICPQCRDCLTYQGNSTLRVTTERDKEKWSNDQHAALKEGIRIMNGRQ